MGLVYGGFNIPGHTGTDFKNKKAFEKSKDLLNEQENLPNVKIESRKKLLESSYIAFFKLTSALSILVLPALLFMFFTRSVNVSYDKSQIPSEYLQPIEDIEKIHAGKVLYRSAQLHLEAGNIDYAQDEIIRFLKLYPKNKDGLQLTYEILTEQCKLNNRFCRDAKAYEAYLKAVK